MTYLEKLQAKSDKISDKLKDLIHKKRMELATEVRTKVLLPFCKKHNLRMNIRVYDNVFILPNGDIVDDEDLYKVIKDPMAEEIKKYLSIDYMGDYLFDYHMNMEITDKDLNH